MPLSRDEVVGGVSWPSTPLAGLAEQCRADALVRRTMATEAAGDTVMVTG